MPPKPAEQTPFSWTSTRGNLGVPVACPSSLCLLKGSGRSLTDSPLVRSGWTSPPILSSWCSCAFSAHFPTQHPHSHPPRLPAALLSESPDWEVGAVLSWERFQRFPPKMAASTSCPKMEGSSYEKATRSHFKGVRKDLSPTDRLPSKKDDIMAVESGSLLPLEGGVTSITSRSVCPWLWHTASAQ